MDKKDIRVFLVSIDYYEYFEVVSIIPFFFTSSTYFWCCIIFLKQVQKTKNRSKLFLKAFKIWQLPICKFQIIIIITAQMRIIKK
jgi:hypothetical protein